MLEPCLVPVVSPAAPCDTNKSFTAITLQVCSLSYFILQLVTQNHLLNHRKRVTLQKKFKLAEKHGETMLQAFVYLYCYLIQ